MLPQNEKKNSKWIYYPSNPISHLRTTFGIGSVSIRKLFHTITVIENCNKACGKGRSHEFLHSPYLGWTQKLMFTFSFCVFLKYFQSLWWYWWCLQNKIMFPGKLIETTLANVLQKLNLQKISVSYLIYIKHSLYWKSTFGINQKDQLY